MSVIRSVFELSAFPKLSYRTGQVTDEDAAASLSESYVMSIYGNTNLNKLNSLAGYSQVNVIQIINLKVE